MLYKSSYVIRLDKRLIYFQCGLLAWSVGTLRECSAWGCREKDREIFNLKITLGKYMTITC